jgi:hypothetical protein
MSVLIEALCLVVTREKLEQVYAGGTEAFVQRMADPALPLRYLIADDHLVCLSFRGLTDAVVVSEAVEYAVGLEEYIGTPVNGAVLDHYADRLHSCDDLDYYHQQEDGFMYCWMAGKDPGELVTPPGWTPDRSRRLQRHLETKLHGAACYCYSIGTSIWVDPAAGEHVEGFSLEPEKTAEQLAEEYRLQYLDDLGD